MLERLNFNYELSGFLLKRRKAITAYIKMISGTVMPTANADDNKDPDGIDDPKNCIDT